MPNLRQVADILIRSVSGGVNTSDSKYDPEYVEALIPQLREKAMKIEYFGDRNNAGTGRLDYSWFQNVTVPVNDSQVEGADYIKFVFPKPVSLGRKVNGLVYIGQKLNSVEFKQFLNRSDVANMKIRGIFDGTVIGYIWESYNLVVFGNNMLEEVDGWVIAANPQSVSGFNIEVDDYPVSDSLIRIMSDLFKIDQNVNIQKPADTVLNGQDK